MDKFSVTTPLTGEYLTTVRLTTGGLCALVGFDVETAEDYKVCVTESLLILKRNGFMTSKLTVYAFYVGIIHKSFLVLFNDIHNGWQFSTVFYR